MAAFEHLALQLGAESAGVQRMPQAIAIDAEIAIEDHVALNDTDLPLAHRLFAAWLPGP